MSYEYTEEQIVILNKLEDFIRRKPSQKQAGMILGISDTTLSKLRNGTYNGDVEGQMKKLADYFEIEDRRSELPANISTDYVETWISGEIYDIIRVCHTKGGLSIVSGDAGIGKTKAAQKFVADNPSNSFLITINPCLTNVKSLLKTIADRIGAGQEKSVNDLWFSIANKLSDGTVLIFDEAQHMTLKNIEILRSFSDDFDNRNQTLGIVFIGNPETIYRMGVKKAEFAQIANRAKQMKIYSTTEIQRSDIEKLFPVLSGHEKEFDYLYSVAQTKQGIRGTVNLFSNAWDNENITYEGLVAMAKFMEMEM